MPWFSLPDEPVSLPTDKDYFINPPIHNHDQEMLPGFICPAPASGFHPLKAAFPCEVQGCNRTVFIKSGGNFNRFQGIFLIAF